MLISMEGWGPGRRGPLSQLVLRVAGTEARGRLPGQGWTLFKCAGVGARLALCPGSDIYELPARMMGKAI